MISIRLSWKTAALESQMMKVISPVQRKSIIWIFRIPSMEQPFRTWREFSMWIKKPIRRSWRSWRIVRIPCAARGAHWNQKAICRMPKPQMIWKRMLSWMRQSVSMCTPTVHWENISQWTCWMEIPVFLWMTSGKAVTAIIWWMHGMRQFIRIRSSWGCAPYRLIRIRMICWFNTIWHGRK